MRSSLRVTLLLALALCACKREVKHTVERVEVSGPTVTDNPVLALSPEQVRTLVVQKLSAQGSFVLLKPGQRPAEDAAPVRIKLELAFTREAQKEGRSGTYAEVGAMLELRRREKDGDSRYEVVGLGEVKIPGESLDERQEAVRQALGIALERAATGAHLQLVALDKKDDALVKDLQSEDPQVREYALRVLADRKNEAAAPMLRERLKSDDPDEVRRAIGGLVELKDTEAVPALIDLSRGKDPVFLRELLFALGAIGGDEAEAYLYTVAEGHDHEAIREVAQQALEELNARGKEGGGRGSGGDSGGKDGKDEGKGKGERSQ
jgi:hypothetical protein